MFLKGYEKCLMKQNAIDLPVAQKLMAVVYYSPPQRLLHIESFMSRFVWIFVSRHSGDDSEQSQVPSGTWRSVEEDSRISKADAFSDVTERFWTSQNDDEEPAQIRRTQNL